MKLIKQYYEYIAVVDFEATCDTNQGNSYPHEIIEFPIVLIDVEKQMIVIY
jgi:3'-5' exoribonuclease 1